MLTKNTWRLTPVAARASIRRATCRNCCAMPVLSSAPLTVNAAEMIGGSVAVRIGLAVAFAVSALSITPAAPITTWLPGLAFLSSDTSAL